MHIDDEKLGSILLEQSYLSEEDLQRAREVTAKSTQSLTEYLIAGDLITNDLMGQAIAESVGLSYADLNSNQPTTEHIQRIPEDIAREFRCVYFEYDDDAAQVVIATDEPEKKEELIAELTPLFPDQSITIAYSLSEDITNILSRYQKPLDTRFSKIIEEEKRVAPEILEEIFVDAHAFGASDIHFEPRAKEVVVRFRVDGVLQEAGRLPKQYYENVVNRIKVQSQLRIDEHFSAQDGAMRFESGELVFDLRTSIAPTVDGEKIALRVLSAYVQGLNLGTLGLSGYNEELLTEASQKPFGMILVTGPTGSGKTTTLYAVLRTLNTPDVNITTIEDPVEYRISGVNQIQTNERTNLTFAKGLRSIVRQDPDIILVGEIRDEETAEIAINAALTGHLLLSTFHANDAATAIPRLLDMEAEPFLLASTLELIIAQRLVRKICDHCRHSTVLSPKDIVTEFPAVKKHFTGTKKVTLYTGKGCEVCNHTGYQGRTAIFEFIRITPELKDLILKNPSAHEIWELALTQGARPLFEDGLDKVKSGMTTLEELLRIAPPR
ncbi:Flp pilus assembly complex ATPase component TadA [Candidatus Kaiserbacteria bacterium]|nr:Flp pilus assembly complex ATPase component TadA [Candidatus Kaiserbacteria bacterium]